MASLLVVTGPPGAGKSTVAALIASSYPRSVLVEGDAFFAFLDQGALPPWLPESNAQNDVVTKAAGSATGQFVSYGYETVYDGVVGPWFLPTFLQATGLETLHYAILMPGVERCVERVSTRTGYGFTDEQATRKMCSEFANAEIANRHVFVDGHGDANLIATSMLARFAEGELVYAG